MRTIFLISLLFASGFTTLHAQRACGSINYQQRILSENAAAATRWAQVQAHSQKAPIALLRGMGDDPNADTVIVIPVVVHVVYNTNDQNISEEQILSQINALNRDFNRQNPDLNQVPGPFTSLIADCRLRFELATVDPDGRATNGIIRKKTGVQYFRDDDRIKSSALGGDDGWDPHSYLNIWVGGLLNTILGYGSFPGAPDNLDGVVIRYDVFGTKGSVQPPFNLGRTLTHELGHWLNLIHLWGDTPCGSDQVDDTPPQMSYHTGCPSFPQNSSTCNTSASGELYMDFMDFTDDACMHLFTPGQKERMRKLFDEGGFRHDLLSSKGRGKPWNFTPRDNLDTTQLLSIYPNPAHQQLTLRSSQVSFNLTGKSFAVMSAMGQVMMTGTIRQENPVFEVGALQTGLYFLKISDSNEKWVLRFVKN